MYVYIFFFRNTKTSVIVTDKWSDKEKYSVVLPKNGEEVFLPIEDLTTQKLEFKVRDKKKRPKSADLLECVWIFCGMITRWYINNNSSI